MKHLSLSLSICVFFYLCSLVEQCKTTRRNRIYFISVSLVVFTSEKFPILSIPFAIFSSQSTFENETKTKTQKKCFPYSKKKSNAFHLR